MFQCIKLKTSRRNRVRPIESNDRYGFLLELPIDLQSFLSDTSSHILPREIINEKQARRSVTTKKLAGNL